MTKVKIISLCFFVILFLPYVNAKSLTKTEQKISQSIDARKNEQLSLLEKLVNINSGTENITGVMQVGNILKPKFEALGFKTVWVSLPKTMHRAPTLVATRAGHQGKRLLLIGHLDTVFPKESPFQRYQRTGNTAKGPGVMDMKGGDLVILYALMALKEAGVLDHLSISVVLTGDEEDSGKPTSISRKPLFDMAKNSDIALDFEPMVVFNTGTIARRGVIDWQIETSGLTAHSASIFSEKTGDGAVFELARILNNIREELSKEKYCTFNPALMGGGTFVTYDRDKATISVEGKDNVVAKSAIANGDLRYISHAQLKSAQKKIEIIISKHLAQTKSNIIYKGGIPSMSPTPQNYNLLKKYSDVSLDLGADEITALDPGERGAGDISHIADRVSASLSGLGVFGYGAHSIEERIDVNSLATQTKRAAILIYRLTHEN